MHSSPQQRSPTPKNQRIYPTASSSRAQKVTPGRKISPRPYVFKLPNDHEQNHSATPQRASRPSGCPQNPCRLCLAWFSGMLILVFLLLAIAAGLFYVVYRPQLPRYSLDSISIERFNLSTNHTLSSNLIVAVRAQNPNKKIRIYHHGDASQLALSYSGSEIGSGSIPNFDQGCRNTTIVQTMLTASGVPFPANASSALNADQSRATVLLDFELVEPLKLNIIGLKIPVSISVRCILTVNSLAANQAVRIQPQSCSVKGKL